MKEFLARCNEKLKSFLHASCFLGPSLLGVAIFFVIPFGVVVYYSLIMGPADESFAGLRNFIAVWNNRAFRIAVTNTAKFTGTAVPLAVVLSLLLFDGSIQGTREGTLIAAIGSGLAVKFFKPLLTPRLNRILTK